MTRSRSNAQNQSNAATNRNALTLMNLIIVVVILVLLVSLLLPPVMTSRRVSGRLICQNNLRSTAIALNAYAAEYWMFPPAYTTDEKGNRLHSWRTLILPFLDLGRVYRKIDLSKPWDDPVNAECRQFRIPTCVQLDADTGFKTTYLAVVTAGSFLHETQGTKPSEARDGTDNTIMIVEVPVANAVHWMSPVDADESMVMSLLSNAKTNHADGTHVAFVDGSVRLLSNKTSAKTLHAMITAAGDEPAADYVLPDE